MKYKILISDPISENGIKILKENNLKIINIINDNNAIDEVLKEIHGWIIRSGTKISSDKIRKAKNLRIIGRAGVGVDNIDIEAATKYGIVVMNVPDGNSISAAEHTIAMILALSRNLHLGHISMNKGLWERANLVGNELKGKTLGVVGLGKIGREVIERASLFGVKILGYDPYINKNLYNENKIKLVGIDELTKKSDIISLHVPLNDSTRNLFNFARIKMMKRKSKIINVSRGGIINEFDLAKALNKNIISGAAVDVFSQEPLDLKNPLLSAKNILLTPHLGASTHEAKEGVSLSICKQLVEFFAHDRLTNAINFPISDMSILKKIKPFIHISELLGKIQSQLIDDPILKVEIHFYGSKIEISPISIAFIKGLLLNIVDDRINFINALSILNERGIELINSLKPQTDNYSNFIDTYVYTKDNIINIGGSVFMEKEFRILKFMGHEINFIPDGYVLFLINKDIPGVVGKVGTILGQCNINIAEYILSRPYKKENPISIIKIDQALDKNSLNKLNDIDEILAVKEFKV